MRPLWRQLPLLWAALVAAAPAFATERMPSAIRSDLNLGYTPQCSLCHVAGNAGPGTAHTPFSLSARSYGIDGHDRTLLAAALKAMESAGTDSDGDGVPDIAELRAGTDPNVAGAAPLAGRSDPSYGCSSSAPGLGALVALLLYGLKARTRSRSAGVKSSASRRSSRSSRAA